MICQLMLALKHQSFLTELQLHNPPPTLHIQIVLLVSEERFHISSYSLQYQQHLDSEEIQSYFCFHGSILGLSQCQQIFLNPSVTFNLHFEFEPLGKDCFGLDSKLEDKFCRI